LDILLTSVGTLGVPYQVQKDEKFYFKDGNLTWLRNFKDFVNPRYVYFWLTSTIAKRKIDEVTIGSTQQALTIVALKSLTIELPPLKVQNIVVQHLEALTGKITLNRQTNQTLEQMAQVLFKSWFVDFDPVIDNALAAGNDIPDALQNKAEQRLQAQQLPDFKPLPDNIRALFPKEFEQTGEPTIGIAGWIPKGWSSKYLSDLLEIKYGKDHKKLDEGEYPVYGSGGLMRRVDKFLYKGESVLIPRKGTLSNIMYVNETFWSVDTMFFTIPKVPQIAKFAFYLLKRLNFDNMNVGSAVPSMTTKVLNALPLVCPSENVLTKFDEIIELYFSKIRANQESSNQLEQLRGALLPKLISGEITINKEVG
jgi:type I restriction enzyme S subunit